MTEQAALEVAYENGEHKFIKDYAKALIELMDADEAHKPEIFDHYSELAYALAEYANCKVMERKVELEDDGDIWRIHIGADTIKTVSANEIIDDWTTDGSDW